MKSIVTSVRIEHDTDVAYVRRTARLASKQAGAVVRDQIRFATAVSEIARNALQYAGGGFVELAFDRKGHICRLLARVYDNGPGIAEAENILRSRHQSHTGLGLGLSGSQKLVDEFDLRTGEGGTAITMALHLSSEQEPVELAKSVATALIDMSQGNPVEELAEQNRALRDSLAEQEFLLRELHHRTKNNLSIIQSLATLQARSVQSAEAQEALLALTNRIQALANAHRYLYRAEDVTQIDLRQHLEGLAQRLATALGSDYTTIVCDVEAVPIPFDAAMELGLIVNELVTNAAKHAAASGNRETRIFVDAAVRKSVLYVEVRDDGPGIPDAESVLRNADSLGWRIIESSARKLNATVETDGSAGLSVKVQIPL